jgi:hypothetical protein
MLEKVLKAFDILMPGFQIIEDKENEMTCLGKLAVILNEIGDTQARDLAARRFCSLKDSVENVGTRPAWGT